MLDIKTHVFTDEHKQKEDLAKIELQRVLHEKDQLSKELNELEQSFSSVVKRLDRCKEVIEGFKKVHSEISATRLANLIANQDVILVYNGHFFSSVL